ncbi:hypothetical protein ColLi_06220 [Colletotrichum liriopes]|uniref:Uncharacterized protein n=1 Tax=Colletotrichum liriopes TaxID=708192 RepID=A0AA37LT28_9PEZI|nr:hypothetical protein ColLi_06220 [Colletotrichum liriopes]
MSTRELLEHSLGASERVRSLGGIGGLVETDEVDGEKMAAKRLVWVKYLAVDVQPRREMTAQTQGETVDFKGPRRRPFVGAVADGFKLLCCAANLLSHARSGHPAAVENACPVNGVRMLPPSRWSSTRCEGCFGLAAAASVLLCAPSVRLSAGYDDGTPPGRSYTSR